MYSYVRNICFKAPSHQLNLNVPIYSEHTTDCQNNYLRVSPGYIRDMGIWINHFGTQKYACKIPGYMYSPTTRSEWSTFLQNVKHQTPELSARVNVN